MKHEEDSKVKWFHLLRIFACYITYMQSKQRFAHACKMEHEDDSESEVVQLVKYFN